MKSILILAVTGAILCMTGIAAAQTLPEAQPIGASRDPNSPTFIVSESVSKLVPASITVEPGTSVTWVNNDPIAHTVTATDGSFDSKTMNGGTEYIHKFTEAGVYTYASTQEGDTAMTGVVIVTPLSKLQAPSMLNATTTSVSASGFQTQNGPLSTDLTGTTTAATGLYPVMPDTGAGGEAPMIAIELITSFVTMVIASVGAVCMTRGVLGPKYKLPKF